MRVYINRTAIAGFGSLPEVDRDLRRRAHQVAAAARAIAPRDTGAYAGSIHVEALPPTGYRVIADVEHAVFVEWDTRPHEIRPRTARALWWPGAAHPVAARVWHPGTAGQHTMARALSQAYGNTHT
ncbi:hypothetical protein GCM10027294_43760 [Marinactinospora endophytica]